MPYLNQNNAKDFVNHMIDTFEDYSVLIAKRAGAEEFKENFDKEKAFRELMYGIVEKYSLFFRTIDVMAVRQLMMDDAFKILYLSYSQPRLKFNHPEIECLKAKFWKVFNSWRVFEKEESLWK